MTRTTTTTKAKALKKCRRCGYPHEPFKAKTEILGYPDGIAVIKAYSIPNLGLTFYCESCKSEHRHGYGDGHRAAHCVVSSKSPFYKSRYYLIEHEE